MTAPDPLHAVTDSATAFEDRLRCADDVELTPAQAAARVAHGHEDLQGGRVTRPFRCVGASRYVVIDWPDVASQGVPPGPPHPLASNA